MMELSKLAKRLVKDVNESNYIDYAQIEYLFEQGIISLRERDLIISPKKTSRGSLNGIYRKK